MVKYIRRLFFFCEAIRIAKKGLLSELQWIHRPTWKVSSKTFTHSNLKAREPKGKGNALGAIGKHVYKESALFKKYDQNVCFMKKISVRLNFLKSSKGRVYPLNAFFGKKNVEIFQGE